jgi:hypothetical protein
MVMVALAPSPVIKLPPSVAHANGSISPVQSREVGPDAKRSDPTACILPLAVERISSRPVVASAQRRVASLEPSGLHATWIVPTLAAFGSLTCVTTLASAASRTGMTGMYAGGLAGAGVICGSLADWRSPPVETKVATYRLSGDHDQKSVSKIAICPRPLRESIGAITPGCQGVNEAPPTGLPTGRSIELATGTPVAVIAPPPLH